MLNSSMSSKAVSIPCGHCKKVKTCTRFCDVRFMYDTQHTHTHTQMVCAELFAKRQLKKSNPEERHCKKCVDSIAQEIKEEKKRVRLAYIEKKVKRKEKKQEKFFKEQKVWEEVNEDHINTCVQVLRFIAQDPETRWKTKRMKALRKALIPVSEFHRKGMYQGMSEKEFDRLKMTKRARKIQRARDVAYDQKMINQRMLREKRLNKLRNLLESNGKNVPLIPDGAVETDDIEMTTKETLKICEDGKEIVKKEEEKQKEHGSTFLRRPRSCYICKTRFRQLHDFYDQLCPRCAVLNWSKRKQTSDMRGMYVIFSLISLCLSVSRTTHTHTHTQQHRYILLTGGRVKIGFQCGLKLLRCGAHLIVTTRFPKDATKRYMNERDSKTWADRLQVVGLDLRDIARLESFCAMLLDTLPRLDAIVNNACQTVRRMPSYYAHLLPNEKKSYSALPDTHRNILRADKKMTEKMNKQIKDKEEEDNTLLSSSSSSMALGNLSSAAQSQLIVMDQDKDGERHCPKGKLDVNGQQIDLRKINSWNLHLHDVQTPELAEVFAINTLAPFILNARLQPLMLRVDDSKGRYVINVSAMEGKFYRHKGPEHPHTNMAKAALNMMTRTCSSDLALKHIYMNSVDTGWINDENPLEKARRTAEKSNFQTPIDEIDAAARVLDPIMVGVNEKRYIHGKFLKDYTETEW